MGSYTFRWQHPAEEVFVTGTFDNWTKSVRLERVGHGFEKRVDLPSAGDKILYKFVVDGHWTTDYGLPCENDGSGNVNNVLRPDEMQSRSAPTSSFGFMPGGFPQTPAFESDEQSFSVNPLPATSSTGNPIDLAPGQPVPHPSIYASQEDHVTLDKESYERSDRYPGGGASTLNTTSGMFGVPPVFGNMIPESSLPIGSDATVDPYSFRAGGGATSTSELAGQVPKESRGVPSVVTESQQAAQFAPEAAANPEAVMEKKEVEQELLRTISKGQGTGESGYNGSSNEIASGVPSAVSQSLQTSNSSPEAAANPEAVMEKKEVEQELLRTVTKEQGMTTESGSAGTNTDAASGVPQYVSESQYDANAPSAATANAGAVADKQEMESELVSKVPETAPAAESGSTIGRYAAEAGAAVAGVAGAAASWLPASIQHAISDMNHGVNPIAALTHHTSHATEGHERETTSHADVPTTTSGNDVAEGVPSAVTDSIREAHETPEAAANAEAVAEKADVERELLGRVTTSQETGEPAPVSSGTYGDTATGGSHTQTISDESNFDSAAGGSYSEYSAGQGVPAAVNESFQIAQEQPEATANPEAVAEKADVERELLSQVSKSEATGESAPSAATTTNSLSNVASNTTGTLSNMASSTTDTLSNVASSTTGTLSNLANTVSATVGGLASSTMGALGANTSTSTTQGETSTRGEYANRDEFSAQDGYSSQGVPSAVTESIQQARTEPEAVTNPEAVAEKADVERELLSQVSTRQESGEPAPAVNTSSTHGYTSGTTGYTGSTAGYTSGTTDYTSGTAGYTSGTAGYASGTGGYTTGAFHETSSSIQHVPDVVTDSIQQARETPEATANPEAVGEKAAVERELLREVPPAQESGEPAPTQSAALSATAPTTTASQSSTLGTSTLPTTFDSNTVADTSAMSTGNTVTSGAFAAGSGTSGMSTGNTVTSGAFATGSGTSGMSTGNTITSGASTAGFTGTTGTAGTSSITTVGTLPLRENASSVIDRVFAAPVDSGLTSTTSTTGLVSSTTSGLADPTTVTAAATTGLNAPASTPAKSLATQAAAKSYTSQSGTAATTPVKPTTTVGTSSTVLPAGSGPTLRPQPEKKPSVGRRISLALRGNSSAGRSVSQEVPSSVKNTTNRAVSTSANTNTTNRAVSTSATTAMPSATLSTPEKPKTTSSSLAQGAAATAAATVGTSSSATGSPARASPSSQKTTPIGTGQSTEEKKKKRTSFFGKIKDKLRDM